jgi:isocitrate lyase
MVTQMAKYLDTIYVSGWQSSSTASASDEPGPDLADYPYVSEHCHATSQPTEIPSRLSSANTGILRPPSPTRSATSSWLSSSTTASSARSV